MNGAFSAAIASVDTEMGGMKEPGLGRRRNRVCMLKYTEMQAIATQRLVPVPSYVRLPRSVNVKIANTSMRLLRLFPTP